MAAKTVALEMRITFGSVESSYYCRALDLK
jgi:hypothetical protein